jgi:transposase-like protein
MAKAQKTYTPEFKREAVRLAQTSGKPITQIARELGISDTSIHQWRKELVTHREEAFPRRVGTKRLRTRSFAASNGNWRSPNRNVMS